jgi:hypothetical protein
MRPLSGWLMAGLLALLPFTAVADPVGYVVGFDRLYRIDLASGQATSVGAIGFNDVEGLAFAVDGSLYGVADATAGSGSGATDLLIRIDTSTGVGSLVAPLQGLGGLGPGGNLDYGLTFTCDARLWLSSDSTGQLWEVMPGSATVRLVGSMGQPISGLAARGNDLYGISVGAQPSLFRIDTSNAFTALVGALGAGGVIDDAGLDFDASGQLWATLDPEPVAVGASRVARIDAATGRATVTANSSVSLVGLEGLAIASAGGCGPVGGVTPPAPRQIPGPGPIALALLALIAAAFGSRHLRRG